MNYQDSVGQRDRRGVSRRGVGLLPVRGRTVTGNYRKLAKIHGNEGNYRHKQELEIAKQYMARPQGL